MRRIWLIVMLVAGCGATPGGQAPPPDVLLDPGRLPGGWSEVRTSEGTWADLEDDLVPCGQEKIVSGDSDVRVRVFRSSGGASVSQLVVSGVDGMDTFKRFYAECGTVRDVESAPGPRYEARHAGELEIAVFGGNRFAVVSGPESVGELPEIAEIARLALNHPLQAATKSDRSSPFS
ncbi:hypothetical protein [Nonomuraea turcica]|uniref:hypothetical protein n=1 Tax=Nonomuraea sp. G32 TaxID=3067274 RepID=UPI00273C93DF|nr:hypothetical protein [Nonomuraea sp. G32]MDP4504819.1 hypothetical protein [Nonomuraea sp. G32]